MHQYDWNPAWQIPALCWVQMKAAQLKEQLSERVTKRLSGQSCPKFCVSSESGYQPFGKGKKNCSFSVQSRNLPQPNASRQVQCYLKLFCLISELWCLPVHKYCGHLIVCSTAIWHIKLNQILTISKLLSDIRYKNKPASLCILAIVFCYVRLWDHTTFDWVSLKRT